jgi:hypothetical protein
MRCGGDVTCMSKDVSSHSSKAGKRWLHIVARILVAVLMVITLLGFLLNVVALVGIWAVYTPTRNAVTDVASTMTRALTVVDNGLTRVNTQVQNARQTVTEVNDTAAKLGDRIQANNPLVTALSQRVDNELVLRVENARTTAVAIHDGVVTVNSTLVTLNRFPGVSVPTLSNVLSSISERAQEAQTAVQDLRVTVANIKAGTVAKAGAAITHVTSRIDDALARIQDTVNKYQAKGTDTQKRMDGISNTILLLLVVGAVSLTLLLIIFEVGLVLLLYVCLLYVRTGRFPSLRVAYS